MPPNPLAILNCVCDKNKTTPFSSCVKIDFHQTLRRVGWFCLEKNIERANLSILLGALGLLAAQGLGGWKKLEMWVVYWLGGKSW
jgi:hypothetical protein